MSKPTVFLSSTCYDLSNVREELDNFLRDRGFDVSNSESRAFGVDPGKHSHSACISAVREADFLLLLVGRRRGGTYIGSTESITSEEYRTAEKEGIPRLVFVERKVNDYRETYRKNPRGDHSHIVNDVRVFAFIDYIASGHESNWLHPFDNIGQIKEILTTQFAHYLWLFSRDHRKPEATIASSNVIIPFPSAMPALDASYSSQEEVTALREGLRGLHEIISRIQNSSTKPDAKSEKLKMLWVLARYGECDDGETLSMDAENFKQYAWSNGKGARVNTQLKDFGIHAYYHDGFDGWTIRLAFSCADESKPIGQAAKDVVKFLASQHSEAEALELFKRGDFRSFVLERPRLPIDKTKKVRRKRAGA